MIHSKISKSIKRVSLVLVIVLTSFASLLSSCVMTSILTNELTKDSTHEKYDVVLFGRVPSYNDPYSFHISLKQGKLKNKEEGNIFIGEYNDENETTVIINLFATKWIGKDTLEITFSNKLNIVKKAESYKKIKIIYTEEK